MMKRVPFMLIRLLVHHTITVVVTLEEEDEATIVINMIRIARVVMMKISISSNALIVIPPEVTTLPTATLRSVMTVPIERESRWLSESKKSTDKKQL
jgi:hypothetical protein